MTNGIFEALIGDSSDHADVDAESVDLRLTHLRFETLTLTVVPVVVVGGIGSREADDVEDLRGVSVHVAHDMGDARLKSGGVDGDFVVEGGFAVAAALGRDRSDDERGGQDQETEHDWATFRVVQSAFIGVREKKTANHRYS